ncbi:MAG: complex I subunit 1 family protein [Myxococcaceae bacterium]
MMVVVSLLVILGAFFGITVGAYALGGLAEGWFKGGANLTNILILVLLFVMVIASLLTAAERKWSSMMQDRIGPNRARIALPGLKNNSLGGIPHFLADGAKMLFKEDFIPAAAKGTRLLFELAPILAFAPVLLLFAVVPAGPTIQLFGHDVPMYISNPDFGILWVFAIASLAVYGTALAGWASNNKFALLGGVRASSQMISYEVALGLGLVGMMMAFSTVQLTEMTAAQGNYLWRLPGEFDIGLPAWGIFLQPVGFILFFAASFAETKRAPFDLPEGESEVIGYFVEYSGMKFGLFMISEFAEIVVLSGVITAIFLGGYHLPFGEEWLFQAFFKDHPLLWGGFLGMVFWTKVLFLCWVQLLIRWTMVRFRYDQVQSLGWKILLPAGLVNVFITGALVLWDPSLRALAIVGLVTIFALIAITWMGGGSKEEAHDHGAGHGAGAHDDHGHAAPAAAAHH